MDPAGVSLAPNCVHCFLHCACETSLTPFPQSPSKWLKPALKIFSRLLFLKLKKKKHKKTNHKQRKPNLCHFSHTRLVLQGPEHHPALCVSVTMERSMNYSLAHINILKTQYGLIFFSFNIRRFQNTRMQNVL